MLSTYLRLPFGGASALALFQQAMDTIPQGISYVICYLDDILIIGETQEEHLTNLAEVLRRLSNNELRLKQEKCSFLQDSIEYLGHYIDTTSINTVKIKVEAIARAPTPKNVSELRSFLGMVNPFIVRFLKDMHHSAENACNKQTICYTPIKLYITLFAICKGIS